MPFQHSKKKPSKTSGFTLVEVMITMVLITMMCLSIFAGLHQITRSMITVGLRSEAYHLLQAESERLLTSDYADFVASTADQSIASSFKTSYVQSNSSKIPKFNLDTSDAAGRFSFTRRVRDVTTSTGTTNGRTLQVEVEWAPGKWTDRAGNQKITALLHRSP